MLLNFSLGWYQSPIPFHFPVRVVSDSVHFSFYYIYLSFPHHFSLFMVQQEQSEHRVTSTSEFHRSKGRFKHDVSVTKHNKTWRGAIIVCFSFVNLAMVRYWRKSYVLIILLNYCFTCLIINFAHVSFELLWYGHFFSTNLGYLFRHYSPCSSGNCHFGLLSFLLIFFIFLSWVSCKRGCIGYQYGDNHYHSKGLLLHILISNKAWFWKWVNG